MRVSANGYKFTEKQEGNILHVYKDQAGYPTIGVGHKLTKTELSSGHITIAGVKVPVGNITEQQSLDLLKQDMHNAEDQVNSMVRVPLTQNQFDAVVDFAFNIGEGGFAESEVLKDINGNRFSEVPDDFKLWDKITVNHKLVVSEDLVQRRIETAILWNTK